MEALFFYFFTIGAGLISGALVVLIPGLLIINKIMNRKGRQNA